MHLIDSTNKVTFFFQVMIPVNLINFDHIWREVLEEIKSALTKLNEQYYSPMAFPTHVSIFRENKGHSSAVRSTARITFYMFYRWAEDHFVCLWFPALN